MIEYPLSIYKETSKLNYLKKFLNLGIVNENVILAGGSLQPLFLPNEKVADYDIYFSIEYPAILSEEFEGWNPKTELTNLVQDTRNKLVEKGFKETFACPQGSLYSYVKLPESEKKTIFIRTDD